MSEVYPKKTITVTVDEWERLQHERDKFKWQVRDTCKRAEKAEAELEAERAEKRGLREALERAKNRAINIFNTNDIDVADYEADLSISEIEQALSNTTAPTEADSFADLQASGGLTEAQAPTETEK